jgi:adhesin transport system outer membrane protein
MGRFKFLALILISTNTLFALTIQDSIKSAIDKNPEIHHSVNEKKIAQESYEEIDSENYPILNLNGKIGESKTNSNTTNNRNENMDIFDYSIGIQQNLFNGYSTTNKLKYQENRVVQQDKEFKSISDDITFKVLQSYYNILKNKRLVEVEKSNIIVINKIYEEIVQSHKSGFSVLSDVKKVESALQNAKYNLLVQENELSRWIVSLEYYIVNKIDVNKINEQDINLILPKTLDEAIELAYKDNAKVLSLIKAIEAQSYKYKSEDSSKYPSLDLVAQKSKTGDSGSSYGDTKETQIYLNLDYKFSFGGEDKARQNKEKYQLNKIRNNLANLKNKLRLDITNVWNKIESLKQQQEHLEYYFIHTTSTIDLYKQEFDIGVRKLLDLLVAQGEYVESEKNLITAKFDRKILKFELAYLSGEITEPVMKSKVLKPNYDFKEYVFSNEYLKKLLDIKNSNKYIINLAVYEYEDNLKKLISNNNLQNVSYAYVIENTKLIKVVTGIFNSQKEATNALKKYNKRKDISENRPYITKVGIIQKSLLKRKGILRD